MRPSPGWRCSRPTEAESTALHPAHQPCLESKLLHERGTFIYNFVCRQTMFTSETFWFLIIRSILLNCTNPKDAILAVGVTAEPKEGKGRSDGKGEEVGYRNRHIRFSLLFSM